MPDTTPGSVLIPSFRYRDAQAAIAWFERVLGFTRHAVYEKPDGTVEHAELRFGTGMIMLGSETNPNPHPGLLATPAAVGGRVTSPIYLLVPDCDAVYAQAQSERAHIVIELRTMNYGGKAFSLLDPEGYIWSIGEYDPWKEHP